MLTNIRFEKDTRYYELFLSKNLFDDWSLSIINGKINSRLGRMRHEHFHTLAEAIIRMHDISKHRTEKRKYHLVKTNYSLQLEDNSSSVGIKTSVTKSITSDLDYSIFKLDMLPNHNITNETTTRANG